MGNTTSVDPQSKTNFVEALNSSELKDIDTDTQQQTKLEEKDAEVESKSHTTKTEQKTQESPPLSLTHLH